MTTTVVPKTVVVAFPWNADDAMLAPLRERFPDLDLVAQPYLGRFGHHLPDQDDELTDETASASRGPAPRPRWRSTFPLSIAELAPELRWAVQAIGAGIDHLQPMPACPTRSTITNAAGVESRRADRRVSR